MILLNLNIHLLLKVNLIKHFVSLLFVQFAKFVIGNVAMICSTNSTDGPLLKGPTVVQISDKPTVPNALKHRVYNIPYIFI